MNVRPVTDLFCANERHGIYGKRLMQACAWSPDGKPVCEFCEHEIALELGRKRMAASLSYARPKRRAAE